jgi:hypothetical protein
MTHAAAKHRKLDAELAEALARDRRERADAAQDRQRLASDRVADERYRIGVEPKPRRPNDSARGYAGPISGAPQE